jgi:hypothetical protein
MAICPMDLEICERPGCAGGRCEESGELRLAPCVGCGYLFVLRGAGYCVECLAIEITETKEV